jgi:hypothetical protein
VDCVPIAITKAVRTRKPISVTAGHITMLVFSPRSAGRRQVRGRRHVVEGLCPPFPRRLIVDSYISPDGV